MSQDPPKPSLRDLNDKEIFLLAELIRLFVRSDGEFSDDERAAVDKIARQTGGDTFWASMNKAITRPLTIEGVLAQAELVGNKNSHELIYGALYELSIADVVDSGEHQLLDRLAALWELDIKDVP